MLQVRPAIATDEAAVLVLAADLATTAQVRRAAFAPIFAELVAGADQLLAVAAEGVRVIGYVTAHAHRSFYANGEIVWVDELMVDEPVRHRGTGRTLMRYVEQWAERRGAVRITLATRRAAAFYTAIGYTESATYFVRDLDRPAR